MTKKNIFVDKLFLSLSDHRQITFVTLNGFCPLNKSPHLLLLTDNIKLYGIPFTNKQTINFLHKTKMCLCLSSCIKLMPFVHWMYQYIQFPWTVKIKLIHIPTYQHTPWSFQQRSLTKKKNVSDKPLEGSNSNNLPFFIQLASLQA